MEIESRIPGLRIFIRICLFSIFFTLPLAVGAQRLDIGFTYGLVGFCPTMFPDKVFFSETSYKAYYIHKLQCPWGPQNNISLNMTVDYNRFFVSGTFGMNGYLIYGIRYKYQYPMSNGEFRTYYSRVTCPQTDLSGSFGYFLVSRRFMRPFIEAGFGRCFNPSYAEDMSTDKSFKTLWSNRTELRNYAELDKPYNYLLLGYGYRGDLYAIAARYKIRLGHHEVYYSNLSIGMSVYTRFSKLRKHYIYQPEE